MTYPPLTEPPEPPLVDTNLPNVRANDDVVVEIIGSRRYKNDDKYCTIIIIIDGEAHYARIYNIALDLTDYRRLGYFTQYFLFISILSTNQLLHINLIKLDITDR